jgi:alpha-ketoglutarate-dependent taurine dioxygenase
MARHAVLVFRDQPLTDEQQLAFTKRFGDLERYETPAIFASVNKNALATASPIFPTSRETAR